MFWTSLSLPWQVCLDEAWAAFCAGSVPIGAVVTDQFGTVLARGRNRIYDLSPTERALWGTRLAHAEVNALAALDHRDVTMSQCVLYTTTEPCPMCIGAIRMCHIGRVYYAARDTMAGSVALQHATPFMKRGTCCISGPEQPDLEALIVTLHVEFALRIGFPQILPVIPVWTEMCPDAVQVGTQLFESRELQRLREENVGTSVMVNVLHELLA